MTDLMIFTGVTASKSALITLRHQSAILPTYSSFCLHRVFLSLSSFDHNSKSMEFKHSVHVKTYTSKLTHKQIAEDHKDI